MQVTRSCVSSFSRFRSCFSAYNHFTRSYAGGANVGGERIIRPDFSEKLNFDPKTVTEEDISGIKNFGYFTVGTAAVTLGVGGYAMGKSVVMSMNPAADVLAMANIEVDLTSIPEGQNLVVKWRGKPLFVRHRTAREIQEAVNDDNVPLRHAQKDAERAKNPKYLIVLGVCTHLGCVPMANAGDWKGYFCPCHGSHYDTSGRIRKGPAPLNLEVPPYTFVGDDKVIVGLDSN